MENELNYKELIEKLSKTSQEYSFVKFSYIGESLFGRAIPLITLGDGDAKKGVLYVSTHHASENICTSLMIRFINEYVESYKRNGQTSQISTRCLFKMRKIYIVPMLNPDGVEYRLNGLSPENPIKDRVIAYNGGNEDFTNWNSNARGVDLNHNYDAFFDEYKAIEREREIYAGKTKYSGEYPESEPEVSALCNLIRYNLDSIDGVLSFHTQGEEIYYSSRKEVPKKSIHISKIISRMTGYKLAETSDTASYGGLTDWLITKYNKPAFTLECGKGENPLPMSELVPIYAKVRELLYTFPILF